MKKDQKYSIFYANQIAYMPLVNGDMKTAARRLQKWKEGHKGSKKGKGKERVKIMTGETNK